MCSNAFPRLSGEILLYIMFDGVLAATICEGKSCIFPRFTDGFVENGTVVLGVKIGDSFGYIYVTLRSFVSPFRFP